MATKKSAPKKSVPKKAASKKNKTKKATPKKTIFTGDTDEDQTKGDCKCKQKRPNGSFFCFRLEQGRWVQASAVPFPTQELCEEANC